MASELIKTWSKWALRWGGIVATIGSIIWSILLVLVAKNDINLIAWVEHDKELYPSDSTWSESLPLTFENTKAESVRLLSVKVSNYGKTLIGKQEEIWYLSIRAPTSSHLAVFGKPKISPEGTVVRLRPGTRPNVLTVELGALQPRASIDLRLMLLNTSREARPPLEFEPSLAGLPHERVLSSPADRVGARLLPAIVLSVLLLILVIDGAQEYRSALQRKEESQFKFIMSLIGRSLKILLLAFLGGGFLALGLGHVVNWFL